ncbi:MAG: T9SS type A sorting domain-containing protein, partial [Bacteroidia bacterium]|nr:T9SS type A sorting domain-containing protein [Bacteroidia bacterium]
MIKRLVFTCALFLGAFLSQGAHIIGGYISHQCLGIENNEANILVDITMFRDAFSGGAPFDNPIEIGVFRNNNGEYELFRSINIVINDQIQNEIFSSPYTLSNNIGDVNLQTALYQFDINIPIDSFDYVIAYQRCCRQISISNIEYPGDNGFALELLITKDGLSNCHNSVALIDTPPFVVIPNADEVLKYPFLANDNLVTKYNFVAPNKAGGVFDAANNMQYGCCECVRPSPEECGPPFDQIKFLANFTPSTPFGDTNTYLLNEDNATLSGRFTQAGLFTYGINVEQYDNNILQSRQLLDYALFSDYSPESSIISVQPFHDLNENGIKDDDENYVRFYNFSISPDPLKTTIKNNFTLFNVNEGTYNIKLSTNIWNITTSSSVDVSELGKTYIVDLGVSKNFNIITGDINLFANQFICSTTINVEIEILNDGTLPLSLGVSLEIPEEFNFVNSDFPPSEINSTIITWNTIEELDLFESGLINVTLEMPDESFIDNIFELSAAIKRPEGSTLDEHVYFDFVRCAYDPNDKLSFGRYHHYVTLPYHPIDYTIRFENTGNFRATDIVIIDELSSDLDVRTLTDIKSNFPVETSIVGNKLTFFWDNILLPPSLGDPVTGHGYVSFKIRPKTGLALKTIIKNQAEIIFDSNAPIITNEVENKLASSLTSTNELNKLSDIIIQPNPNSGLFKIDTGDQKFKNIECKIYSIDGKVVRSSVTNQDQTIEVNLEAGLYYIQLVNID